MATIVESAFAGERPIALRKPLAPELYFRELAEAIVNQQLSIKAAATIWQRFDALVAGDVTPERILTLDIEQMRASGVSRQKAGYLQSMASAVAAGEVDLTHLSKMDDADVIAELTKLKGIGPWTVRLPIY